MPPQLSSWCAFAATSTSRASARWAFSAQVKRVHVIMKRQRDIVSFFGKKKLVVTEHETSDSEADSDSAGQDSGSDVGSDEESEPSRG